MSNPEAKMLYSDSDLESLIQKLKTKMQSLNANSKRSYICYLLFSIVLVYKLKFLVILIENLNDQIGTSKDSRILRKKL